MQAGDVKLGMVFAHDHHSVIPLFQRPYVWREEDNWDPLWKDIRKAAEDVDAEQASGAAKPYPPTYFLGAVVVQQRGWQPNRLSSSNVIDGQQRMTTVQVLLAAARAVAASVGARSVAGQFASLIENRGNVVHQSFPEDRHKVWPLPQDRAAFLWAVRAPDDGAAAPDANHPLVKARNWFEGEIAEWAKGDPDPARRLGSLSFAIQDRIQVVQISLGATDDPQVIFEALNHRGVQLAAADLVKNLLFQTVESQGDGHRADSLLTDGWMPLDGKRWRAEITTGRIKRVRVDLLLTYWLTARIEQDVPVEHLFAEFKRWLGDNAHVRAADVIKDIRRYADTYMQMLELPGRDPAAQLLDRMESTGTTTPWPVLLYLYANDAVPEAQRRKAVAALDSFLMRRGICALTTKDYNRLFVQVLSATRRANPNEAGTAVVRALLAQTAESRSWPTDSEFIDGLISPNLFKRVYRTRLRALLVGLENHLRTGMTEPAEPVKTAQQGLSIEHVLPQGWEAHWSLPPDASEQRLAQRANAVHQLGNLTLTTSKLNSSLSNETWSKKKHSLRRHSLLRLTTGSILTAPYDLPSWTDDQWSSQWNEDRIALRTLWLAGHAQQAWSRGDSVG